MDSVAYFAMYITCLISLFALLYVYKLWKKTPQTGDEEGPTFDIEDPFCFVTTENKFDLLEEISPEDDLCVLEMSPVTRNEAETVLAERKNFTENKFDLLEEISQEDDLDVLDMSPVTRNEAESVLAEMKKELDVQFDRKDDLLAWLEEHGHYAQDLVHSFPDLQYELDLLILEAETQHICLAA